MSDSVNPNVPVQGEGQAASKANSEVSFNDLMDVADKRPGRQKPEKAEKTDEKPEPKKESSVRNAKESGFDDVTDDKPAKKDAKPAPDAKEKPQAAPAEPKAKPKVHKFKAGDKEYDLTGDAVVTIPVDGERKDVPLQELVNRYNGAVVYDKRLAELDRDKKSHSQTVEQLNAQVKTLYEKAQKDPEAGIDFLAELTKQDPVKIKEANLRQTVEQLLPIAALTPEEREQWIKDRVRDWRDKHHESRQKFAEEESARTAEQAKRQADFQRFGIGEDEASNVEKMVREHLKQTVKDYDGKVSNEQIVWAHRQLLAHEVVREAVPHLEKHAQFDSILEDVVSDMIRHPSMTREKLAKLLTEVWGPDNDRLKSLGRKAAKTAEISDDESPVSVPKKKNLSHDAISFDDLD